ncbi:hypothetical protein EG329_000997 [Mollisiaceae sp. DMI_Dod_QoI]|nr:hypothetical protein EG329_000997 [Helotiales sp. DMI_Dod_QoI]
MSTLSTEEARLVVAKLREENGGITPEDRAACPPGVLRALENVRRKLGSATKTLATNLYSKDTRFVYELIQNAEDNKYTQAKAKGLEIYLSFSLYKDKVVIESNEDGFCEEDVRAICSTGESTKTKIQGYIGEKGIGFKSVFKVAKKVHIQSGPFSFSFEHTKDSGDDGLGMITPIDELYDKLPEGVGTRLTLTLLDPSSFEQRAKDLRTVPNTLLLFLTKLNALYINIYPQNESSTKLRYISPTMPDPNMKVITITTTVDGDSTESSEYFYVAKRRIKNLPHDEARKHTSESTIVLAFPITKDSEPIVNQQHVYAFLPLRLAGFTFLIQADFITQASREDVFHSARNRALLAGVAKTFRAAVLRFCDNPSLRYKWMRWLPSDSISDEFWKELRFNIISLLNSTHCLQSWSGKSLCLPSELYWLPEDYQDRGEPLFADLDKEAYLSKHYTFEDFKSLGPLGTSQITYDVLIPRVRSDLEKADSKMKATVTDRSWHQRAASLLSEVFTNGSNIDILILSTLELIPLQDGRWVSATTSPIFFPETGNIPIPPDLYFDLVMPSATREPSRKSLFSHFGVKPASPAMIISMIHAKYASTAHSTLSENISHLRYLYWNLPQDQLALNQKIFLINQYSFPVYSQLLGYIYFEEEEEEYGPKKLFQTAPLDKPTAPGLAVHFLNRAYLDVVPAEALHHGISWKQWLNKFAGVRTYPQLRKFESRTLSDEFEYIMERRCEKLIGLLKRYWEFYQSGMTSAMVEKLKNCLVPVDAKSARCLKETFLPLPKLKSIVKGLHIAKFPFLTMPGDLKDKDEKDWRFLRRFGVRYSGGSDDLYFYAEALRIMAYNDDISITVEGIFKVYEAIQGHCSSSDDATYIWHEKRLIYIPSDDEWVTTDACVWTAPEWLEAKKGLARDPHFAKCQHLFRIILKMGDANWKHYLEDLESLKEESRHDIKRVLDIYHRLWREFEHDSTWDAIRTSFEESELLFLPSRNTWHPLSSCIWAEDQVRIPRKTSIKSHYASLDDFFCRILGIAKPNLEMNVQALKELAHSQPAASTSEIKRMIMFISSMGPTLDDVKDLRRSNIFPVKILNQQNSFTNALADFAIVDRSEYGSAFAGKIRILDYSIEEVRASRPLLLALGMRGKHLSELVEEETTVRDGAIDSELSQRFRSKAYALFRCAVHYRIPQIPDGDRSLYNRLLRASIHVSDGISKSISVIQYGETITIENSRANFHLDEKDDELLLYVPRDKDAREECFFRQLPRRLMKYFAISDLSAEALLNGIIGCSSLISVDNILKDAGIVQIDGIGRTFEPELGASPTGFDDTSFQDGTPASTESRKSESRPSTPVTTNRTAYNARTNTEISASVHRSSSHYDEQRAAIGSSPLLSAAESIPSIPLVDNELPEIGYVALLERVITSAGRMAIPVQGYDFVDELPAEHSLGIDLFESVFAARSMERDRKVGAAGELFIFEILLNLELPGFTEDNWKSTIRKEVRVHNRYRHLAPWMGRETADITYIDSTGQLTKLFIDLAYLDDEIWADARPTYYLEIKTTTRDCSEQFYMSGPQYERMQKMRLQPQSTAPDIYVILRVFNLEGKIGFRVYVDPESSRLQGELEFNVDTWAVKHVGSVDV